MATFFRTLTASCLGTLLALGILLLLGIAIAAAAAGESTKKPEIRSNTVLRLTFKDIIPELTNNAEIDPFQGFNQEDLLGLHDILATLRKAKTDPKIKGIFLDMEMPPLAGYASAKALRDGIADFKKSGKFVVAHAKIYMQADYHLASVADQVYVNPGGLFEVRGLAAQVPFFKNLLDKMGVKMQIYYAGKFKGATEPYRLTGLSAENRLQYRELLQDFYSTFLNDVARSRRMLPSEVADVVGNYRADSPEAAQRLGLVDGVLHRQEVMDRLRRKLGFKEGEKIPLVSLSGYYQADPPDRNYGAEDKVAVLYAEGTISDGKANPGSIGDISLIRDIEAIAADKRVKGVVLRINSPGGSALASENIWYALSKLKEKGKPLVVSMGDYAASGGYYIACMADSILAEENTLTGSIGVFRIIPSLEGLLEDKVGVTFDTVKTGRFAQGINPFFDIGEEEGRIMQRQVDTTYALFLDRVATGRRMTKNAVDAIAQGRVWSGTDAIPIGLVDKLGTLSDAVRMAARMGNSKDYRITEYPRVKSSLEQLVSEIMDPAEEDFAMKSLSRSFPGWRPYLRDLEELRDVRGIQARLPGRLPLR